MTWRRWRILIAVQGGRATEFCKWYGRCGLRIFAGDLATKILWVFHLVPNTCPLKNIGFPTSKCKSLRHLHIPQISCDCSPFPAIGISFVVPPSGRYNRHQHLSSSGRAQSLQIHESNYNQAGNGLSHLSKGDLQVKKLKSLQPQRPSMKSQTNHRWTQKARLHPHLPTESNPLRRAWLQK